MLSKEIPHKRILASPVNALAVYYDTTTMTRPKRQHIRTYNTLELFELSADARGDLKIDTDASIVLASLGSAFTAHSNHLANISSDGARSLISPTLRLYAVHDLCLETEQLSQKAHQERVFGVHLHEDLPKAQIEAGSW